MMETTKKKEILVEPSLSDLSEKKSERTTFKLTREATDDLVWLQEKNQLSAKELFEYLCTKILVERKDILSDCIERTSKDAPNKAKESSIRKTYVLSRGSIKILTDISKKNNLSRDILVSNLISAFRSMVKVQIEEEQKKQKKVIELINKFYTEAKTMEEILKGIIPDTSTLEQFRKILGLAEKLANRVNL
jgi:hypothetical protein